MNLPPLPLLLLLLLLFMLLLLLLLVLEAAAALLVGSGACQQQQRALPLLLRPPPLDRNFASSFRSAAQVHFADQSDRSRHSVRWRKQRSGNGQ